MPPELVVFLLSMIPIAELRLAIPLGIGFYNLSVWSTFFWAFLGNIIPIILIIWGLDLLINKLAVHRVYILNRFFTWLFEKTRERHSKKIELWRDLALVIFVAIPLPGTGAWTGALIAFVFGIPIKRAFPLISLGVLIAGVIVTLITLGIINLPFV